MSDWTEAKNDRRCDLIDKDVAGRLSMGEQLEMVSLQDQMLAHRRKVAPLPIAEVTELHDALKLKVPKRPHQSKLFATGLTMLTLGLAEVHRAIGLDQSYVPGILTAVGGLMTIIFRRVTDRPFRFTREGRDG